MAELRQDVAAIQAAGKLCLAFHAEHEGHLTAFRSTVASLRGNWESKEPTQIFDDATAALTRHANEQQAAIEKMRELLVKQGANLDEMNAGQTADLQKLHEEIDSLRNSLTP